jgi:formylglycine-generating enzyme required for sulfatase activity
MLREVLMTVLILLQGASIATKSGAISGRILAADGSPAPNVRVAALQVVDAPAQQPDASLLSLTTTDAAGRYRLENIPPGRYHIMAGPVAAPFYFPGVVAKAGATVVAVKSGDNLGGYDFPFIVPKLLKVSGRVSVEDDRNQSGRRYGVQLNGGQGAPFPVAGVAPDGSFELSNVWPGTYQLFVLPRNNASAPVQIVLEDKDIAGLRLALPPAPISVTGTVRLAEGGPPPPFQLRFTNSVPTFNARGGLVQGPVVRNNPDFTVQLGPGDWTITAENLPAGYSLKSISDGSTDLLRQPLKLVPGHSPQIVVTLDARTVRVSGRIAARDAATPYPDVLRMKRLMFPLALAGARGARGGSINAAIVGEETLNVPVGPNGEFEFAKVVPGAYAVDATFFVTNILVAAADTTNLVIAAPDPKTIAGEFVNIPPGEFIMGCSAGDNNCVDDEKPAHRVRITKGFEMGKYEVTQAQWAALIGIHPTADLSRPDHPVAVDSNMAGDFIRELNSRKDGYVYRLPTEAEWEYAARAGETGAHPGGGIDQLAWHAGNSSSSTHPVGNKLANAWGLHDMLGNVSEWTQDWYDPAYYVRSPVNDPAGRLSNPLASGSSALLDILAIAARGGGFDTPVVMLRVSKRFRQEGAALGAVLGTDPGPSMGFRLVREAIR